MKPLLLALFALAALDDASADADRLCQAARAAVERLAASKGWAADVRCRAPGGRAVPASATLQVMDPPPGALLRSGPATWAVRV
ncbi:hypothetical protein DBR42_22970, partial [Pelomonas sp. HMWF004]